VLDEIDESVPSEDADVTFPEYTTAECEPSAFIRMNHSFDFELREAFQYVNINVFGRSGGGGGTKQQPACLLGYLNLPLTVVLAECAESNLGHFLKRYPLNPPNTPKLSNHHLSTQSGFDPNFCYGDILLSFVWNENLTATTETIKKQKLSDKSSASKAPSEKEDTGAQKPHDFIRTHFHRATTCDFCGKKIWLKDAVQCRNCVMCCHKKCITKCQNATVCLPADGSSQPGQQVEFKLTEAPDIDDEIEDCDDNDEVS
jgi:PDZ domain-containing protein 8